ncbi:hypothetical protein IJG79_01390 [Candidatus Saccharibacteria bacterium]|nr:hypothetical protein [Candidatus Saccharibacteria bacterium]
MIDIHCHILPGIDDGSKSFNESLEIIKKAQKEGITDIILTPHYIVGTKYDANNAEKKDLLAELKSQVNEQKIPINLYLGNEIFIDPRLPEMMGAFDAKKAGKTRKGEVLSLNEQKYVLIELPVQNEDFSAPDTLFELIRNGWVPVIAHPERYAYIQHNIQYAEELIRIGCVLQGDYLALVGKYGKREEKTLKKLLKKDMIFCLASDIHHERDDYRLSIIKNKIEKVIHNQKRIEDMLVKNPKKILLGR